MEFRQLRYFVAVAEELHFGRAAQRCHVAQPALSRQVRSLEEELGALLLERTSRKVVLTREGEWFLDQARDLLGRTGRMADTVGRMARGEAGRLRILFIPAAADTPFPDLLRAFRADCPDVGLELRAMNTWQQLESLRQGRADLGLVRGFGSSASGLQARLFHAEDYVLAVPRDHGLARKKTVRLAMLDRVPFIGFPRSGHPELHDHIEAAFRAAGAVVDTVQETAFKQTALALVTAGLGVALVPESMARIRRPGVRFMPLDPADGLPRVEYCLVWPGGSGPAARERFLALAPSPEPSDMAVDAGPSMGYRSRS